MNIRSFVQECLHHGKDLFDRLGTPERAQLTDIDLHLLRVQLHVLEIRAANAQKANLYESIGEDPSPEV